ncbi:MAG: hypothetical protein HUJ89_00155 [Bacteroidales bacterium]|nr:hypothetical protein [Bacteroidales bacterium]
MKRYIIRALKSLVWFLLIFAVLVVVLVLLTPEYSFDRVFAPEGGMFQPNSEWKILAFFIACAAIYPGVTYVKKEVFIEGEFEQHRDKIISIFGDRGYRLEKEDDEKLYFRAIAVSRRLSRLGEDGITLTKGESPLFLSGHRKDIIRLEWLIRDATRAPEE